MITINNNNNKMSTQLNEKTVLMIGKTRCGKSTLLDLLLGVIRSNHKFSIFSETVYQKDELGNTIPIRGTFNYENNLITFLDTQGLFDASPINGRLTSSNEEI